MGPSLFAGTEVPCNHPVTNLQSLIAAGGGLSSIRGLGTIQGQDSVCLKVECNTPAAGEEKYQKADVGSDNYCILIVAQDE